jgi:hypothetical protein
MKEHVTELRPTQFALGMIEVEHKIKHLSSMSAAELDEYLHSHPVPVVRSPQNELFLIDHHHLVRAAWELDIAKVCVQLLNDLSHLPNDRFWKHMADANWMHPYDQFGRGPHSPELLPHGVRGLADDPFRSLAWAIRERGGFEKTEQPFCEFHWADHFRKHVKLGHARKDFEAAIEHAMHVCKQPEAKHLPGYRT